MASLLTPTRSSKMRLPSTLIKCGFSPSLADLNHFLLLLSRKRRFKTIIHIFSQLKFNKIYADAQTHSVFAKALLKENKFEEAVDLLKTLQGNSTSFLQNRLFDSLVQRVCAFTRDPERGLYLLEYFSEIGRFSPSSRTSCLLIFYLSKMGKMDRVIDLLELMSGDKFRYAYNNFVCSCVISGFVRIGEPDLAVRFYETSVKSGSFMPNTITCTAVVTAYCKLRSMDKISDLVTWMQINELDFDVVFYSNWIYGCLGKGLICEAFQRFSAMEDKKIMLDNISYTILIDGFSKEGNVEKAVGFLYKMKRDGVEPNLLTYTAIILGFCKKGKLDEAFAIFRVLKMLGIEADEYTYAILIDGLCRRGQFDCVFQLLDEMLKKGINPSVVTYNTIINGFCKVGKTAEADDFSKGVVGDVITYSTLLHGYLHEKSLQGILETKRRLEASGLHMDVVVCNILIKAMLMVGLFEDACAIYKGLTQMDLSANSVTYYTLIDGYCKAGRIDEALEIFDDLRKTSNSSAACYNHIILELCRKGMVDMAIDVLIEYTEKGFPLDRKVYMMLIEAINGNKGAEGVSKMIHRMENIEPLALNAICNDTVTFLCKMNVPEASCSILLLMRRRGLALAATCYYSMLRALLFGGKRLIARLILTSFLRSYGILNLGVSKILVNYLCLHDVKKALAFLATMNERKLCIPIPFTVFKILTNNHRALDAYELLTGAECNLPYMNIFYYSIVIDALCKIRHIDKALDLCSLAKKNGIALNIVIYNSVINGLCRQGCLVEAFRLYDSLEKLNVHPTEVTYGTLIDALVRESLLRDARMLFERMLIKDLGPTTHIYNSLINGYCKAGLLEEATELFRGLEMTSLKPDGFTVGSLINGYVHRGDMEGALMLFSEFKRKGSLPDFLGFMYLVRGLCAKGRMEESRSILRVMLHAQSVVDLFARVNLEIESDSVENLLIFLCERGSIHEAVAILDEVGNILFPTGRNTCHHGLDLHEVELEVNPDLVSSINSPVDPHSLSPDIDKVENTQQICATKDGKLKDFDSFYSLIHSHCSKGEFTKANRLTKLLMEF